MPSGDSYDTACTSAAGQIATTWDAVAEQYTGCSLDYGAFSSVSTCDEYVDAYATLCEQVDGCIDGIDTGGGVATPNTGGAPSDPSATVVVSVSIVEGAADEPTAAEAVSTLQSLYASGELQRALADGCITDELAEAPELHIAPAGLAGAALILAIVLPIVGCLLVASLIGLAVYCCCCKGKKAAAGAPAQPTAVEISTTAHPGEVSSTSSSVPPPTYSIAVHANAARV